MKYKAILVALTIVVLGLSSTVLVFESHRSASNLRSGHDLQASPPQVSARLVAMLDLQRLISKARVIVVGRVVDSSPVARQGSNDGKAYVVTLLANRVLKGSIPVSTISIDLIRSPDLATETKSITPSLYAIFFLNEESPHVYALADRNVEAVVAAEGAPASRGEVLAQVINELRNVIVSPASSQIDQLQAVAAVTQVYSPAADETLHRAFASKEANVRLAAEAGLLRHNDIPVLEEIQDSLLRPPADMAEVNLGLSAAIRDGIRDPKALPILARLLSAPDPRVRRAAAHALRETHVVAAIDPLSSALNDSDQMVRYDAVLGLSEITGDLTHAPSVDMFKRDENKYLAYWRERAR